MSAIPWRRHTLLAAAGFLTAIGAGCGTNPPCQTDLSAVDAARSSAAAAESQLEETQAQKARLEDEVFAEKARRAELERRKAELEARIRELEG